jgi:hypothetical protein
MGFENGTNGHLMKNRADTKVRDAICRVGCGHVYFSAKMISAVVSGSVAGDLKKGGLFSVSTG